MAGYAGWVNPEEWALPSIATLMFLPLFVLTVIAAVLWAIFRRLAPTAIAGYAVVAALLYPFSMVSPINFPAKAEEGETQLKLLTYNVHHYCTTGLDGSTYPEILEFIRRENPDILCIQEASLTVNRERRAQYRDPFQSIGMLAAYPYRVFAKLSNEQRESYILSRYPLSPIEKGKAAPSLTALARVHVKPGLEVDVVTVHFSSFGLNHEERDVVRRLNDGVESVKESAKEMKGSIISKLARTFRHHVQDVNKIISRTDSISGRLIICGDFNDVPTSYCSRQLRKAGFRDAYSEAALGPTYTFNDNFMLFHIDQVFHRGEGIRTLRIKRGDLKCSDHYPLVVTFAVK